MSPPELLQKLGTLVPRPRLNLTRFHGVLASNAKWRSQVVCGKLPVPATTDIEGGEAGAFSNENLKGGGRYTSWAYLLKGGYCNPPLLWRLAQNHRRDRGAIGDPKGSHALRLITTSAI